MCCTGTTKISENHTSVHLQAEPLKVNATWSFALPALNLSLTVNDDAAEMMRGGQRYELILRPVAI